MDRMIYTALTAMNSAMARQRAVANNLANASTPGFRAEEFSVTPATIRGTPLEARTLAKGFVRGADMAQGKLTETGRNLDIAVKGTGLIAFQNANGEEVYSRRGDLRINASGVLENGAGKIVLGEGGPITLPANSQVMIGTDGSVLASDPATPDAPPTLVDRIKLVSTEGSPLLKGLDNLLAVPGGGTLPTDPTAEVLSGTLEGSNVDTTATLVDMIEAQRAFEQRAKIISTAGQLDEASTRLMSLS